MQEKDCNNCNPPWFKQYSSDIERQLESLERAIEKNTLAILANRSSQEHDRETMRMVASTTHKVDDILSGMKVLDKFLAGFVERAQKIVVIGAIAFGVFVSIDWLFDFVAKKLTRLSW